MSNTGLAEAMKTFSGATVEKVAGLARDTRATAAEMVHIKALLARGAANESKEERDRRHAWLRRLATNDTRELKAINATQGGPDGGYGVPTTIARATEGFFGTLCPWIEPDLCGVQEVTSGDHRETFFTTSTGEAGLVGETGTRSDTYPGAFVSVVPTFGEFYSRFAASTHAVEDLEALSVLFVRVTARQIAAKLASSIVEGNGSSDLHGFMQTAPSLLLDDASPSRAQHSVQYVPASSSPQTTLRFADVETLLGEFREEYLADPSFAIIMRAATWRAMVAAENIADAALLMSRNPTLYGYPVRFSGAMPAIGGGEFPVAAGAWREGYLLCRRGEMRVTNDIGVGITPGTYRWVAEVRYGGVVRDHRAIKLIKCGA